MVLPLSLLLGIYGTQQHPVRGRLVVAFHFLSDLFFSFSQSECFHH